MFDSTWHGEGKKTGSLGANSVYKDFYTGSATVNDSADQNDWRDSRSKTLTLWEDLLTLFTMTQSHF
jgi:hypothetical protein